MLPMGRILPDPSACPSAVGASMSSAAGLPIIDCSAWDEDAPAAVTCSLAEQLDEALCGPGFCILVGCERLLPAQTVHALREVSTSFFALEPARKEACAHGGEVGYVSRGGENVAATTGDASAHPDIVESLNLSGYQEPGREWCARDHTRGESTAPPWASAEYARAAPPELVDAASAYWAGATRVMRMLMTLSEVALDLPSGFFDTSYDKPGTLLRLAWYPQTCDDDVPLPGQWRYGAHTDYDGFTILQRDELDGDAALEIQFADGQWQAVDALPNSFTINIGDLLARWTNDRWRATPHRVRPAQPATPGARAGRLSLVYFTGPHPDTVVERLPSVKCQGGAKYEPITAAEHVQLKIKKAAAAAR